jgi:hypothetical protein
MLVLLKSCFISIISILQFLEELSSVLGWTHPENLKFESCF